MESKVDVPHVEGSTGMASTAVKAAELNGALGQCIEAAKLSKDFSAAFKHASLSSSLGSSATPSRFLKFLLSLCSLATQSKAFAARVLQLLHATLRFKDATVSEIFDAVNQSAALVLVVAEGEGPRRILETLSNQQLPRNGVQGFSEEFSEELAFLDTEVQRFS